MSGNPGSVPPVLVIMGVSGVGKSRVGADLASRLGWAFQEGDALHPAANITKMAAGRPLDDQDRAPWLRAVAAWIDQCQQAGHPGVITCSALTRSYRDQLRRPGVLFVCLLASREELERRLQSRVGHFMPASLLDSQLNTLEPPGDDERAVVLDASADAAAMVSKIVDRLDREGIR